MLLEFKILPSVRLFINSERWQVVGFCPRAASAGVFGDKPERSFSHVLVLRGRRSAQEQGNRTIMHEHSYLAIEFYNFKFRRSPWYSEDRVRGAIHALARQSRLLALSGISL